MRGCCCDDELLLGNEDEELRAAVSCRDEWLDAEFRSEDRREDFRIVDENG